MKYRLISLKALLMVCLLAGCQQKGEIPGAGGTGQALTFQTSLEGEEIVQTKAYSKDIDLKAKGFTVAGYHTEGQFTSNPDEAIPNVLNRSKDNHPAVHHMTYDATAAKFRVELPEICGTNTLEDGMYISYFSWSQGDFENGYGITGATSPNTKGFPYIDVNLRRPDGTQGDIVAAQALDFPNDYVVTAIDLDFHHLLSKLTFLTTNSSGTTVQIMDVKLNFGTGQVYSNARYTFNCSDSVGSFNSHNSFYPTGDWQPSGWITPELPTPNPVQLGEALILPQKLAAGAITVKITYTLNGKAPITRILPLKDITLCQGKNYIYTLDIHADQVKVINAIVGKWNESPTGSLPLVPGPCGDDILLLEGTDMPYEYNGKKYWLDRSGYNNHCEIIDTSDPTKPITWSEGDKGYLFYGAENYIKVPDLGTFDGNILCELICTVEHESSVKYPTPIQFENGTRHMLVCLRHHSSDSQKDIVFDYGGYERMISSADLNKRVDWTKKAFYAFKRQKGGYMSLTRNSTIYEEKESSSANDNALLNNGMIGKGWKGQINYVKISKNPSSIAETSKHYEKLANDYSIRDEVDGYIGNFAPPVQLGLVLCYDARQYTSAAWVDQSFNKYNLTSFYSQANTVSNNAAIFDGTRGPIYNNGVFFNSQSYTLEIVSKTNSGQNTIISFHPDPNTTPGEGNRQIHVHLPWDTHLAFVSPGANRLEIEKININVTDKRHNYSFIRNRLSQAQQFMEIWQDGKKSPNTYWPNGQPTTREKLEPIGYFSIGGQWGINGNQAFIGEICTIRLYNRALTPEEIQKNYEHDRAAFGL